MAWFADTLLVNDSAEALYRDPHKTASQEFLMNVSTALLHLAMPIVRDEAKFSKVSTTINPYSLQQGKDNGVSWVVWYTPTRIPIWRHVLSLLLVFAKIRVRVRGSIEKKEILEHDSHDRSNTKMKSRTQVEMDVRPKFSAK